MDICHSLLLNILLTIKYSKALPSERMFYRQGVVTRSNASWR